MDDQAMDERTRDDQAMDDQPRDERIRDQRLLHQWPGSSMRRRDVLGLAGLALGAWATASLPSRPAAASCGCSCRAGGHAVGEARHWP